MGVCMQFWGLNDMGAVEKRPCSDVVGGKSSFRRSEDLSGCGFLQWSLWTKKSWKLMSEALEVHKDWGYSKELY